MKEFVVLGSTVKVDDELEIYIRIKKANEAGKRFMEKPILDTYNAIDDVDALIEQLPEFISELPKSMAELAVSILVGYDVYTVDEELFLEKYYEDYLDVTPIFYPLVEKYYKILDMADEMAEYQKALRESHKRWVGGGFGIKGALSGALKAQILNQANVAFHAIPDHTTKVHNEQTIVRLKRELVHNPEILEMLRNAINHVLDGVFAAVINELEEENVIEHYEFETKKAQAIYNNLMAHANELDDGRIRKLCLQIIDKDILFYPVYLFMAIRYNDESDAGFEELTRELGFYETIESDLEEIHERTVQQAMQDNADEIAKVKNECEKVNNNETLFVAMEDCIRLMEESPILDLYDSILEALKNRMFFPMDGHDGDEIKNTIKNHGDFFTKEQREELYGFVNESVKEKSQNAIGTRLYEKPVEIRNGFFKMADYSPVSYIYLYELGRKGNAVAQDVVYECFYGFASRNKEVAKYRNEIIERIDLFLPSDLADCDNMSAFDLFWLGIRQYLTGENNRMDWIIQSASEGCAIANYFMYLVEESPKDEAYINKAVMLGSVTANIVMINRVKEKNPELVDKYARNLGYSKEELSNVSVISSKATYATLGPTGNYGGTERIRTWLEIGYLNDAIEEIKRIDKACKDRFYFYPLLLKNGTVRYLLEDEDRNYDNMTGGRLPVVVNDTGEFTCFSFVFSKALIFMTNQGVMYKTQSTVDFEAYKTYKPGRFDYAPAVADYPNIKEKDFIKLIEDVIAYMTLYSLNNQKEMNELFYPSLRCEIDMCVKNEEFDDDVKLIINKMKQNDFKDAATYALDLYKKKPENKIPYIFYLAILKNAQASIRPDWFDEYSKIRECNMNRSDVLLEAGKVARSRSLAIMELPDDRVFEFYCKAAAMGNREAIDFVSLMCKRNFLWGVSKEWAEQWMELKNSCNEDKTNIFSLVEELYLKNGNRIVQDTKNMPEAIHNVTRKKRYYDEDFNLEKRKDIFNKLSIFLNDELSWKCQTYLTDGDCLEQNNRVETAMRNYYKIPQSETIYAFVDAGLPSRVNRGLVFTESAIYCVDKDHKLNRIAWNRLTFADKIYEDRFMGFYFNGKRLFGNEDNKTRQICRYIDYGINPNRNYDLFGNNDIKSL